MTAFVLERAKKYVSVDTWEQKRQESLSEIYKYANFLSRQTQLSDFVPCGEDGLPLDKPKEHLENRTLYYQELEAYQQALDKVLFKGFYVAEYLDNPEYTKAICCEHNVLHVAWYSKITCSWHLSKGIKTLEHLTPYNLELTEKLIKDLEI